jgi:hypothetical protein
MTSAVINRSGKATQFLKRFKANGETIPTDFLNRMTLIAKNKAVSNAKISPTG